MAFEVVLKELELKRQHWHTIANEYERQRKEAEKAYKHAVLMEQQFEEAIAKVKVGVHQ